MSLHRRARVPRFVEREDYYKWLVHARQNLFCGLEIVEFALFLWENSCMVLRFNLFIVTVYMVHINLYLGSTLSVLFSFSINIARIGQ
jgi:hypothetical protein